MCVMCVLSCTCVKFMYDSIPYLICCLYVKNFVVTCNVICYDIKVKGMMKVTLIMVSYESLLGLV